MKRWITSVLRNGALVGAVCSVLNASGGFAQDQQEDNGKPKPAAHAPLIDPNEPDTTQDPNALIGFGGNFTPALSQNLKLGNGLDAGVEVGPMFEKKAMDQTVNFVEDAKRHGAKVLTGGKRSERFDRGYFFEPTVLSGVGPDSRILIEEPFAPVMPILDFSKIDDVIRAANNTRYGLAAYVFTNDLTVAWRMAEGLEAGIIGINDPVPSTPQCPFGGMKESGLGRELAHEGLEAYLETKYISFKLRDGG